MATGWAELELNPFAQHEVIMLKSVKIALNTFLGSSQRPNCVRKKNQLKNKKMSTKKKKKTPLCKLKILGNSTEEYYGHP